MTAELLCMEPGQKLDVSGEERVYYVVAGSARLGAEGAEVTVPAGQMAATGPQEAHHVTNDGQQRLVCVVIRPAS